MNRIILLAALVAAPSLTPALAQSQGDPIQRVGYADLDLTREADVRKLDRRIGQAIKNVCGTASDADPEGKNEIRRCRTQTSERLLAERGRAIAAASRPTQVAAASDPR
jgi:UrcA family protein